MNRVDVIGRDIVLHAVYWPAMLLSAAMPLLTVIVVHGFLTRAGRRMSKTLGTGVVAMATSEASEPPSRGGRWNCARWAAGPGLVVVGPSGCGNLPSAQGNRAGSRLLRRPRRLFARAVPAAQTGPRRERSLSTPRACYRRRRLFVIIDNLHNVHDHPHFLGLLRRLHIHPVWTPTEASWLNAIAAHFGVTKRATLPGSGRSGLPRRGHGGASMPQSGEAAPLKRQSCRPRSRSTRNLFPGTAVAGRFCLPPGGVPEPGTEKEAAMLWTIVVILLVLWALGMITSYTIGGVIHLLLVIAVIVVVFQFISGRRSA
jgi:Family of unknown function (DUF5670)/tRNA synthetases class I (M)